ncbi:sulfite exporter TauE/SafE family protein [Actinoplanes sp. NPDC023801]|uniref:sulfite exporter TauE/SafE family protein n=1 Tax=Actinoplanes sp. NPDC023801 TaxID=3154595 RepID=UPI0033C501D0
MEIGITGLLAGFLISIVTAPVGVSGAVFLLPVQLSVLHVPNPAVTPTNLLYNVVAGPGALLRYLRQGGFDRTLTRLLILGTLPGVIIGAFVRVFALPGPRVFRIVVAAVLLPLGLWLCLRAWRPARPRQRNIPVIPLGVGVGVIGGIYGIGGGSLLGPVLAGGGIPMATVAPAALASTFVTSIAGAATFGLIALITGEGQIAPHWALGLLCGLGGLIGGYLGARLQRHIPEAALRFLLGALAVALAISYVSPWQIR